MTTPHEPGGLFATTHWSVVLAAGDPTSPQAAEALDKLCRTYWYPLYAHVRRQGYSPEGAQDLTQEFFVRILRSPSLSGANREKGRFRSFLLGALKHFLADARDEARAKKRGGGQIMISWEQHLAEERYAREPVDDASPDRLFERRWALTLLKQAVEQLDHPNIVPIYEVGEHEGQHYFSMKLIEGRGLDRELTGAPSSPRRAARWVAATARAVHYAHQHGGLAEAEVDP